MLNNSIQGRPLAKRCLEKCWEIEKEESGLLQTMAVSAASACLDLVNQLPDPEDEKYIEHDVNRIWEACEFILTIHRRYKALAKEGRCSRCEQLIENFKPPVYDSKGQGMTAGYYVIGSYWEKYANKGEVYVCDSCMWQDPRYIEVYGNI